MPHDVQVVVDVHLAEADAGEAARGAPKEAAAAPHLGDAVARVQDGAQRVAGLAELRLRLQQLSRLGIALAYPGQRPLALHVFQPPVGVGVRHRVRGGVAHRKVGRKAQGGGVGQGVAAGQAGHRVCAPSWGDGVQGGVPIIVTGVACAAWRRRGHRSRPSSARFPVETIRVEPAALVIRTANGSLLSFLGRL